MWPLADFICRSLQRALALLYGRFSPVVVASKHSVASLDHFKVNRCFYRSIQSYLASHRNKGLIADFIYTSLSSNATKTSCFCYTVLQIAEKC